MDALLPGHAHRSSSDRLLNNYLNSQKSIASSLLNLLSHSHTSTSSLLAYVTSSPGVVPPVRRCVRHAAFEGPLSSSLVEPHDRGSQIGSVNGIDQESPGWAVYIGSLEQFQKDLKQIHLLEEELSRVKRDREILVTRLIKTTKTRPTKSDLSAIASSYRSDNQVLSSRASTMSVTSNGSTTSKESKRTSKLQSAQAELLGCEEHLRSLEVRIEQERNKVMLRGLEERFRAMEAVGRMWVGQAKRGLSDLESAHELPADAFELDSNPSIAPSQSASQIAYDDLPPSFPKMGKSLRGAGSITGSIVEEDEGNSSGEETGPRKLIVHENRPISRASPLRTRSLNRSAPMKPSPLGVPSINTRSRPLSTTYSVSQQDLGDMDSSDSDAPAPNGGGRRAASDVGAMGYRPPTGRQPLRRTFSEEQGGDVNNPAPGRPPSDSSSIRAQRKKKGFFSSISRFFKGGRSNREGSIGSGRASPPYGSSSKKGAWHTRTDSNIKRNSTFGGRSRRGRGDSSSDDERGNFISVSNSNNNNRNSTFSVANMGRVDMERSSTPLASGLVPTTRPTRSDLGANKRGESQSTITGKRATSPTPARAKTPLGAGGVSRSNTVKSNMSTGTAKSGGATKKTRQNGSISRAAMGSQQAVEGRTIMSLVDLKTPPVMPEVPKAPKSQVTPFLDLAKAPGSSLPLMSHPSKAPSTKADNIETTVRSPSRADSVKRIATTDKDDSAPARPPSRMQLPPLKSALRPSSPSPPGGMPMLSPPIEYPSLYSVAAPGPVQLPKEEPKPVSIPAPKQASTPATKRNSYTSASDAASVYESAVEDEDAPAHAESSSEEEDHKGYDVVENDTVARAGANAGPPAVERIFVRREHVEADNDAVSIASEGTATGQGGVRAALSDVGSRGTRRKSVRMAVPESAMETVHAPPPITSEAPSVNVDRAPSPLPDRKQEQWSTRIGRMREDTSDEEDRDEGYTKARKGLFRNSGQYESPKTTPAVKRKSSQRSKTSAKGSARGL